MTETIAILCSDIHFSRNPPAARSSEPDWYKAMGRQWDEVYEISNNGQLPIIIAGDIFDRWNSPPELINFVIDVFSPFADVLAIPGQHDLPNHVYEERYRSAYGTLERAGAIRNLDNCNGVALNDNADAWLFPFPWGLEIEGVEKEDPPPPAKVAVCHSFICFEASFPGSEEQTVEKYLPKLKGYDVAVFGDNHRGFKYWAEDSDTKEQIGLTILNCGTFYRRHSTEIDYKPMVGLLQSDGTIKTHYLDVSQDEFLSKSDLKDKIEETAEFRELMDELKQLGPDSLDFRQALRCYMERQDTDPVVREVVNEILGF